MRTTEKAANHAERQSQVLGIKGWRVVSDRAGILIGNESSRAIFWKEDEEKGQATVYVDPDGRLELEGFIPLGMAEGSELVLYGCDSHTGMPLVRLPERVIVYSAEDVFIIQGQM